ncbi:MAG: hypothetical protein H7Z12_05795 [Rhodospirillaceae bacterium]|nr:hypothetical protein [Rhodospirillales bacterium]
MNTAQSAVRKTVPPVGDASLLPGLLKEIGHKSTGWHALLVGLSALPVGERRTQFSQSVASCIEVACTQPHGTLVLPNRDVLVLVRDQHGSAMAPLADLVIQTLEGEDLKQASQYIRRFNLERELSAFIALLSGVDTAKTMPPPMRVVAPRAEKLELENRLLPKDIAKIEKMFFKANVVNFIRNQTAYRLVTETELEENSDEIFISIDYLIKNLAHQKINADVWLFQYFTRTLDARILYLMGAGSEGERKKVSFSLNLNVATLFTEDFLTYDKAVPPRVRKNQLIEMQAFDLVENANEMPFVRGFLHGRGYRLCVDGVSRDLFMLLDWDVMDVEVVKLKWSPDLASGSDPAFEQKLTALAQAGRTDVVLCRCEDEAALDWGARVGIKHFQGWYLDGINKPRAVNQPSPRYKIRLTDMVY